MDDTTAAIVVGTYHMPGQTFVNRHIQHLFGGRTCVVANTVTGNPYDKPVFDRGTFTGTPGWKAAAPFRRTLLRLREGTGNIPYGAEKAAIKRFLRDNGVSVILSEFGTKAILMTDIAQESSLPVFTYFRGSDASYELSKSRRRQSYARMMPRLSGVVAVSRFLLDNLAAHGLTHPNSHVIPSGVDTRRFTPGRKTPRSYLAVGRMVPKKSSLLTLRAFAEATRDAPDASLRFIGDGPDRASAQALAHELGVADRVRFDGARSHDVVRDALATSQVFLQHSVTAEDGNTEGQPTAIQEALAAGCLVIATRHAGIPEIVEHGVNGWLCDEHDFDAYTGLIRDALDADCASMARAARDTAETRLDNAMLLTRLEQVLKGSSP